ncbi:MAG: hypothetical protein V4447_10550 [Pseudomonadota bacterium]
MITPIAHGWTRIPEPAEGGNAYWNRETGLYAIVKPSTIAVTKQGFRPAVGDCGQALAAFQFKGAQELPTGRDIFRRFEKLAPMVFGAQCELFKE